MRLIHDASVATSNLLHREAPSHDNASAVAKDTLFIPATNTIIRQAPATCGELLQGAINGHDFLVNCPIDRYSTATIKPATTPGYHIEHVERHGKVVRALKLVNELMDVANVTDVAGLSICIDSDIPRGKGMASSSADLAAAVSAFLQSSGRQLSETDLSRLFARVEPSDCVHLTDIAHVDHLNGKMLDRFPAPVGLGVIVIDCGGKVETIDFDRERARAIYRSERPKVALMLEQLRHGLRWNNLRKIASAATMSATLSQEILPKPSFESLLVFAMKHGALGVNCAHSGTVMGVLFPNRDNIGHTLVRKIQRRFNDQLEILGTHNIIGGGCS